jgi:ribonuclease R
MTNKNNQTTKEGVISAHPKGFGFLSTAAGEEFFVPPPLMRKVVPGDTVLCSIIESPKKAGQLQAGDIRVVERKPSTWQGTINVVDGRLMLVPDAPCFMPIEVRGLAFAAAGVVSVRTEAIDLKAPVLRTRLERILGARERRGFDQDYALALHDFPPYFDRRAHEEAARIPLGLSATDLKGRADLRNVPFVTIDGESTRDFDDAVFGIPLASGGHKVYVAIADVSHYVRPGSALDHAARERGTSVYLPGKTVPMLPEKLSNGVCSLVPGEDRLVVVAELELDDHGKVQSLDAEGKHPKTKFYRAVMRSAARLTYSQVQAWMDNTAQLPHGIETSLTALTVVFRQLLKARGERGQMSFDDKEAKLVVREDGEYSLEFEQRTDAHKLVEELMLLANHAVGQHLKHKLPAGLFRHQATPDQEDWDELKEWATAHGLELNGDTPTLPALSQLIGAAHTGNKGLKAELAVRGIMQSAVYQPDDSSHFSLGYETYTHFTSPIRRLADLLVHRLLLGESLGAPLVSLGEQCSRRAHGSRMAERYVWDRIKKRLLARDVAKSEVLSAHVVSSSRRGLRVVIPTWQCSALLESDVLQAHGCEFDAVAGHWVNGTVWEQGHKLSVSWVNLEDADGRTELYAIPEAQRALSD